jgi:hypothetical protein
MQIASILHTASIMDQDSEHPINNAHQILRELLLARVLRLEHGLACHVLDEKTKKHLTSYQDERPTTITRCLLYSNATNHLHG